MSSMLGRVFKSFTAMERHERLKLLLLALSFFLVIGAYTIVRDLKNSIFITMVGKEYVPWMRLGVTFALIPAILFYSFLVDKLRRYQLLYFYSIFYGVAGLICAYLLGHPVIGLPNTVASPYRLFGWLIYFLTEGFSPFVISVFWAFANSIYDPEAAKENYAFIVTCSKLGGMMTAGLAWYIFTPYIGTQTCYFNDVVGHQVLFVIFSVLALLTPIAIRLLVKKVPGRHLHGYEAVYQFEKEKKKAGAEKPGVFSGLFMLLKWPYVLGIFGLLFFYEVVSTVLSYHRLGVAEASSSDVSGISCFLFQSTFIQQFAGLLISVLGTRTLLHVFGERICLLLVPFVTLIILVYFTLSYTPMAVVVSMVLLQALNYAFAQPVRESLYIPTIKDMKFKSKSWIDAFGSRFAKSVGSTFNIVVIRFFGPAMFFEVHAVFFAIIMFLWFLTAYLLGKRYSYAIAHNEVIGLAEEELEPQAAS